MSPAAKCPHCGKPLNALKRLTGSEGFCSDACRTAYHGELSRMALDRLIETTRRPTQPLRPLRQIHNPAPAKHPSLSSSPSAPPLSSLPSFANPAPLPSGPVAHSRANFLLDPTMPQEAPWTNHTAIEPSTQNQRGMAVLYRDLGQVLTLDFEDGWLAPAQEAGLEPAAWVAAVFAPPEPVPVIAELIPSRRLVRPAAQTVTWSVELAPFPGRLEWESALRSVLPLADSEPPPASCAGDPFEAALAAGVFSEPMSPELAGILASEEDPNWPPRPDDTPPSLPEPSLETSRPVAFQPETSPLAALTAGAPNVDPEALLERPPEMAPPEVIEPEPAEPDPVPMLAAHREVCLPEPVRCSVPIILEVPPLEFEAVRIHTPRLNGIPVRPRLQFGPPPGTPEDQAAHSASSLGTAGQEKIPEAPSVARPAKAEVIPVRRTQQRVISRSVDYRVVRPSSDTEIRRVSSTPAKPDRPGAPEPKIPRPLEGRLMPSPDITPASPDHSIPFEAPKFAILEDEPSLRGRLIRSLSLWIKTGSSILLIAFAAGAVAQRFDANPAAHRPALQEIFDRHE